MAVKKKASDAVAWRGVSLLSIGFMLMYFVTRVLEPFSAMLVFWVGFAVLSFGVIDVSSWLWFNHKALKRQIAVYHKSRLAQANKGVVWIWAVCLAGIVIYSITFYVLVYPALEIIGVVEGLTTWSADATFTLNFVRTVLNWHPIIFIVGLLIWAYVNSQRREDVTYPYY